MTNNEQSKNKKGMSKFDNPDYARKRKQIRWLIWTGIIMAIGLFFFKIIPMEIYGQNILFDASAHITITMFILYFVWFYIDQNKTWRVPYLIFSLVVLAIVSMHRILVQAHNGTGLILGFLLSVIAIMIPRWSKLKNKFEF